MSARTTKKPRSVFATYIRGGTSKALFFHDKDIPPAGPTRDKYLIRMIGSPDPNQIDGMGGTRIVTSKVAIIAKSSRPNIDVDYTFCQIALGKAEISYSANCGNISAGVGPFAINEDLVSTETYREGRRIVRIYNTGTDAVLIAHVPIDEDTSRAKEEGSLVISGCPGSGAPILMDYSETAKPERMLPTGNIIDKLDCTFGTIDATFCAVGNQIVFVEAEPLGIVGAETRAALDSNSQVLERISEVRGRVAHLIGKCSDWKKVDEQSPLLPMVALVSKPTSDIGGVQSRLFLDNHCHQSMAGTGAICTAVASRINGSVVNRMLPPKALNSSPLQIQHPAGHFPVEVTTEDASDKVALPKFDILGFGRTARYIFQGHLFVPADFRETWS